MAALRSAGACARRIELPVIWPVLATWWRTPVDDVAAEEDERTFLLSVAPARVETNATVFAGAPPSAIAGMELVCVEFERRFHLTRADGRVGLDGGASLVLWYDWGPAWEDLRARSDWNGLGVSTPEIDAFADGCRVESLIDFVETRSGVVELTAQQPARALVLVGDDPPDWVVLGDASGRDAHPADRRGLVHASSSNFETFAARRCKAPSAPQRGA
jgi:hypothetical protein